MPPENDALAPVADNPAGVMPPQAPVTPSAPADPPSTVLAAPDGASQVPADWMPDWREKMAAGDEKELARLQRLKSPVDVYKSYREAEKKLSAGTPKLGADATPEQIAAYRKDNGIPDKADGYLASLPNGLVIGDADKPMLSSYLEKVHGKNASPEIVAETLSWYYAQQEEIVAAQAKADKEYSTKSADALREEWGVEFRGNINSITAFLDAAPQTDDGKPLKGLLMDARLGDGTRLGDNPTALKWLARLASDANPAGFISPNSGTSQLESVSTEIATIEARMAGKDRAAYFKDEKAQARYRQLLEARDKLSAK